MVTADVYGEEIKPTQVLHTIKNTIIRILLNSSLLRDFPYHKGIEIINTIPTTNAIKAIILKIIRNRPKYFSSSSLPFSVFDFIRYRETAVPIPKEMSPK